MFDGFRREFINTGEVEIHAVIGGEGPPLLLLHGFPQSHVMWHRIAPALAEHYTVVATDLRGYGDSSKPAGEPGHETYSKRAMAEDQVAVMAALGFDRFRLVGHDRGARVAHRLCLDHPDAVAKVALLDIVPTLTVFETVNQPLATAYYHWFFLIQPGGLPEHLIGLDPEHYLRHTITSWGSGADAFSDEAMAQYLRCFCDPAAIHAACEDYRAAASIDLAYDRADRDARIACPALVLWGLKGVMERVYDVVATWRDKADDVRGHGLDCGHFLAEEKPDETLAALLPFLET
ncbi:MAG: alpha/beta fold hydrolase [Alphaproteobacteria bacterium]|jgi:haloacetate dehalogenase|nr:alpha/beta fold hydrolase [Alphaproteobacteria bacterium]